MDDTLLRDLSGQTWSIDEAVQVYADRLLRAAFLLVHDHHLAQDMVQETFTAAAKHWRSFRGESRLYTWLYTILLRNCRRQQQKKSWNLVGFQPLRHFAQIPSDGPDPDQAVLQSERTSHIQQALMKLGPEDRAAVVLFHYEELPIREIAEILQEPVGTTKSRLHRSRSKLRDLLEEVQR